ncbi:hypothetical protein FAI40_04285 [Acetobacteraceae bacterium]|nr:hypothetical protein FAI40_04285 [Acetobacteraceae bacterium]
MAVFRANKKLGADAEHESSTAEGLSVLKELAMRRLDLAQKNYELLKIKGKINAARFANELVAVRWTVWTDYVRRIFFVLEATDSLDEEKIEEANRLIETIIVTDKLKWTFEIPELHKEADLILSSAAKLSMDDLDLDNVPEITADMRRSLNKIDQLIASLMKVRTEV